MSNLCYKPCGIKQKAYSRKHPASLRFAGTRKEKRKMENGVRNHLAAKAALLSRVGGQVLRRRRILKAVTCLFDMTGVMVPAYCIPRRFIVVYVLRNSRFSLAISF
jgi:hypothetical protein